MTIKDKDVSKAFNILKTEFENMEALNHGINMEIVELQEKCDDLTLEVDMLKEKVKKLEEALIEAHLTGAK
jgi:uncharacterized coiled-coil protein SlyX